MTDKKNPPVSTGRGDDGTTTLLGSGLLPRNVTVRQYIANLFPGSLSILDMPTPEQGSLPDSRHNASPARAAKTSTAIARA